MLTLPDAIVSLLIPFATLFTSPTPGRGRGQAWRKAQVLLVGAILTPGQRTVAAALRVMGLSDNQNYARYHEVLNRAVWSSREAARVLLVLLLQQLDRGDGPLIFGIDETLERRRGAKIKARAIYRDPVRSSRQQLVKASGLRWISLMWLGQVPWAGRHWALAGAHRAGALVAALPATEDAGTRSSPTGRGRWSCSCAAGCPSGRWCWWATTATPCWICFTAANPSVNPLPSLPDYVWTPLSMLQRQPVSRVRTAARG